MQDRTDEVAFFTVLFNDDLWKELKKWMFPGKKVANFDDYRDGAAAVRNDYITLIKHKRNLIFTEEALIIAMQERNIKIVKLIMDTKDILYVTWTISRICHSMTVAVATGYLGVVSYLHKQIGSYGDKLRINIDPAAEKGYFTVIKFLREKNTAIICADHALDLAAKNGHLKLVKYLHHEDISRCTKQALNYSASNGHFEVVKYLIENKLVWKQNYIRRAAKFAQINNHLLTHNFLMLYTKSF